VISYAPGQRYAVLAKSGSGKTVFTVVLASSLVPPHPWQSDWQVWWLDTKHDPTDRRLLYDWGFRGATDKTRTARRIFSLSGGKDRVYEHAQLICQRALEVGGILLVFDEYGHVCKSRVDAGPFVEDVHKRGRGLDVGSIGGVQEPAYVPRYLFSQANHLAVGALTHLRDVKIARELNPLYAPGWPERPDTVPDAHGFWWKYLDGHGRDGMWVYWPHVGGWHGALRQPERV